MGVNRFRVQRFRVDGFVKKNKERLFCEGVLYFLFSVESSNRSILIESSASNTKHQNPRGKNEFDSLRNPQPLNLEP
jgi:hypothetical protein